MQLESTEKMCFLSVGRSATLQSILQEFAVLAENYLELGNHPSRSLLLNSFISSRVWDLYLEIYPFPLAVLILKLC